MASATALRAASLVEVFARRSVGKVVCGHRQTVTASRLRVLPTICRSYSTAYDDRQKFAGPHPEADPKWRAGWMAEMKEAIFDSTRASEEAFETQNTKWLDGRYKRRERKFFKIRKTLFGEMTWEELTDRQRLEWKRMLEALVDLELSPSTAILRNLGDALYSEEEECALPPDDFEFSSLIDWKTQVATPHTGTKMIGITAQGIEESQRIVFDELSFANIRSDLPELTRGFTKWSEPPPTHFLRFESQQRFELNPTERTTRRDAKIVLKVTVTELGLSDLARSYFLELVTTRYNADNDELRLVGNRLPTSAMNREFLRQLLTRLVVESKKLAEAEENATAQAS